MNPMTETECIHTMRAQIGARTATAATRKQATPVPACGKCVLYDVIDELLTSLVEAHLQDGEVHDVRDLDAWSCCYCAAIEKGRLALAGVGR